MILRVQQAKLWRLGWTVISGLVLAYGVLLLSVRVHESAARSRSEAMYADFLRLRPGETTKAQVGDLRKRWADSLGEDMDCGASGCVYTIGNVWGYSRWYFLTWLAHDHLPSSELTLRTTGDVLSSASFSAGVIVPKGSGTREERKRLSDPNYVPYSSGEYRLFGRASLVSTLSDLCCDSRLASEQGHQIWGPSGCENCLAIWVSALPTVEPAIRAQLFQINFDCMTKWSMCTDKEDIMPTAGREMYKDDAVAEKNVTGSR